MASLARYCQRREAILLAGSLNDERAASPEGRETVSSILRGSTAYTEYDAKRVLAAYGVPVTREDMATSEQEAVDLAERIGYPVVLKIQSPSIRHKTEVRGVMTGLREEAEVRSAYRAVLANAATFAPEAVITGVLVQEYVTGGLEVIVGAMKDPVFGPCIMFGLGGIFVEILKDVSFRIAPLSRRDAEEMVREVRGYALLEGVRGQPSSDIPSLVEVLLNVSRLAQDFGDQIEEIDINPLLVFPDGVRAIDALIVGRQT
jgi:acetyltransferase